jgi:sec-independent protein translocase protein TatB
MNIFGVGGWELLLIILIALVVAGPKRLAVWAYHIGLWSAKLQDLWGEFARSLQQEMDDAGVNVKIPNTPPNRDQISRSIQEFGREIVKNAEAPIEEVKADVQRFQQQLEAESEAISRGANGSGDGRADAKHKPDKPPVPAPKKDDDAPPTSSGPKADDDDINLGTWGGV